MQPIGKLDESLLIGCLSKVKLLDRSFCPSPGHLTGFTLGIALGF